MILYWQSSIVNRQSSIGWVWFGLKWTLCLLVLLFVGRRAWELWNQGNQDQLSQIHIRFGWLVLAGLAYLAGGIPAAWFWQKLLRSWGGEVGFAGSARAYYCGQLGKYVPGKAAVLIIRAALVRDHGVRASVAVVTATVETLLMMAVGMAVVLSVVPLLFDTAELPQWPSWLRSIVSALELSLIVLAVICAIMLPICSRILTRIAVRMSPTTTDDSSRSVKIDTKLMASGVGASVLTWILFGLSLGLTLRAISVDSWSLADWPVWVGVVSAATVLGFVAIFAPGGVGVRECVLLELLSVQPGISEKQAVATALLLRLVWIAAEISAAAVLYYMVKPKPERNQKENIESRD